MDIRRPGLSEAPAGPIRFTNDDVVKMYASGVLPDDMRIELIDGEIFPMPSEGDLHAYARHEIIEHFMFGVPKTYRVATESSLFLFDNTELRPDLYVFPREMKFDGVRGSDIKLVVELMASSHRRDRDKKRPIYARAGVQELWLIDLDAGITEVCRDPKDGEYAQVVVCEQADVLYPKAFPDLEIKLAQLLRDEGQ